LTGTVRGCSVAGLPDEREVTMNGNGGALSNFLTKLSEDPQLQQAYTRDPEGTLRQAGLPEDTIGTLLSRDLQAIKSALERELPGVHTMCFMVVIAPET
jgi:hypothetical protein